MHALLDPDEPVDIGPATGLVYCRRCGFLLRSDSHGETLVSGARCRPAPITLREHR